MKVDRLRQTDNSGFSLVELIVSILIMSVIAGIVVALITSSQITYNEVKTEAVVQGEAETVRSFINEIAIEAKKCGKAPVGASGDKCIWFYAPDNTSVTRGVYSYYFILHEKADQVLRYAKYDVSIGDPGADDFDFDTTLAGLYGDAYSLLAEHVAGIDLTSKKPITITVNLKFNNSDYTKNMVFTGRNMN